jgi:hypothetical protein
MSQTFEDASPLTTAPAIAGQQDYTETSRKPMYSDGRLTWEQTLSGKRASVVAKINDLIAEETKLESIQTSESNGGTILHATVTYRADEAEWSVEPFEIPADLATHPYFQLAYIPESGVMFEELIAQADTALANGEVVRISASAYAPYLRRYYALRQAGVEQYPRYGISLKKRGRTKAVQDIVDYMENVGFVRKIAQIGAPADTVAMLSAMRRINEYSDSNPANYATVTQLWEFVQRVPRITGADRGPWDYEYEWWGLDQWSAVLYPGGSWDPDIRGKNIVIT